MVNRTILNKLQQELSQPEILILLGPRQVGKTTLLRMLEDYAKQKGLRGAFFDLEQPQVLADFNRPDKEIAQIISEADEIYAEAIDFVSLIKGKLKNLI